MGPQSQVRKMFVGWGALYLCIATTLLRATAWHACDTSQDDSGSIFCPDGNKCCPSDDGGSYFCISGKNDDLGDCCGGSRGCGALYQCASPSGSRVCDRNTTTTTELPRQLPQYQLCTAFPKTSTTVYYTLSGAAYLASHPLDDITTTANFDTVWIVVHGSGHNPDDYLCCAKAAVGEENINNTLILTPWFLPDGSPQKKGLQWLENGPIAHTWRYGANAIGSNTSSYAVVDELIQQHVEGFPQKKSRKLIVAGHSAGGQYVQRWALLTDAKQPFRAIVANPKSFCWLDNRRYHNKDGSFRVPDPVDIALCPSYNEWEWGWESSKADHREHGRLIAPYVDRAIAAAGGVEAVVQRYAKRELFYLAGELDMLPNGDCEARMQGDCRLRRSEHFYNSLREIFGQHHKHKRFVVSGIHHDHCLMFQSPEGQFALFGLPDSVRSQGDDVFKASIRDE